MVMLLVGYLLGDRVSSFTLISTFLLVYLIFISAVVYTLWGLLLANNDVSRVVNYSMKEKFGKF